MGDSGIRLGPLALLLAVISICVETLGILSIATASADLRIAGRYADTVKTRYALESDGQMFLREAEEAARSGGIVLLPETETDDAGITWKEIWRDDYRLTAGIRADGNGNLTVVCWRIGKSWEADTDMGNLWNGQ